MSLHRLIELAQKTGDKLIVHDPINGRDMVILRTEQYEQLLDNTSLEGQQKKVLDFKEFLECIENQISEWSEDKTLFEQELFWDQLNHASRVRVQNINDKLHPEHNWHSIADVLGYERQFEHEHRDEQEEIPPYQPPEEKSFFAHDGREHEMVEDPEVVPLESVESPRQENQELTYEIPVEPEPIATHIPAMPPGAQNSQARARMHEGLSQYKGKEEEQIKGNMPKSTRENPEFKDPQPLNQPAKQAPPIFFDEPV